MRQSMRTGAVAALAASTAKGASLADVFTVANVQAALPANGTLNGINPISSSVTAKPVYNATVSSVAYDYCNVTVTYAHPGKDQVVVWCNFPSPDVYKNRFYVGGGGGYALGSDPTAVSPPSRDGAAHCSTNTLQPGPYPADNMATMIDWIENGIEPERLNATVGIGTFEGEAQKLCAYPLRPIWDAEGTLYCEYDQASIESWIYTLDALKMPVY
ncbi:hypothetical protein EAF00_010566 [Botryotinia globosa]|nr:hypothetical protein EAF00_010566 [Botryotinia globosa]